MKVILLATLVTIAACSPAAAQDPPTPPGSPAAAQDPPTPPGSPAAAQDPPTPPGSPAAAQDPPTPPGNPAPAPMSREELERYLTNFWGAHVSAEQIDIAVTWLTERPDHQAVVLGVIATDSAELRESPPHGPLNLFIGSEIQADIGRGTFVEIVNEKHVGTFHGREVWYGIRPLGRDIEREWWINAGTESIGGQTPGVSRVTAVW